MNENLEKDKIQLGNEKPQLLPSKSLLNTIKRGFCDDYYKYGI